MTSIIDQAIHLEESAENHYRTASQRTTDPGAARILELLADQEAEHARVLREMEGESPLGGEVDILEQANAWVQGAVEGAQTAISQDAGLLDVLNRAMDIEHRTETFYQEQAQRVDDPAVTALFSRLAKAERKHYLFVGSLVEYFNRPSEWVEDAEFGMRAEY